MSLVQKYAPMSLVQKYAFVFGGYCFPHQP
jgi:hypothetical protein